MSNKDPGKIIAKSAKSTTKQLAEGIIQGYPIGRDKTVVPPDQVEELAGLGCTNREIAQFFGIEESNVSRHFAANLEKGRSRQKIRLRRAMMDNATKHHNAAVQIFLAKNMLKMSDMGGSSEDDKPLPWVDDV